ncbi:MAG: acyl-CoA dehydrogenase family protein [Acidimicrobiales bacterium]
MTDTATAHDRTTDELLSDVRTWLAANWDPDLSVSAWWERLGAAGWSAPGLPVGAFGKGASRSDAIAVAQEIAAYGALGAPAGLGLLLAAPTIAAHGTPEQIELHVWNIVTGKRSWCQLFSEPQAGSDLAGLQTRATKDGEEWVVDGQKVWTSGGQYADMGMLLARTDADLPKHQGISYFALDMRQKGVEVRPLREMTGRALFNEVFLTEARVGNDALIGGLNRGWTVANTTLMNERAGLGSGGGNAAGGGLVQPGTVLGTPDRRVGDVVDSGKIAHTGLRRRGGSGTNDRVSRGGGRESGDFGGALGAMRDGFGMLAQLARSKGMSADAAIRQDLARCYTLGELGRFNRLRLKAVRDQGGDIPGMPNIAKLSMSQIVRLDRDLGLRICGAAGTLHAYDDEGRATLARNLEDPLVGIVTEVALFAQAPPIYGGTDQVQRNIIGERVLGLPKEQSNDRTTPFSDLPHNA